MDAATRRIVCDRARHQCEYCGLAHVDEPFYTYHVEHVIPRQHGGTDEDTNLALACPYCNRHKGPNLTGRDPLTGDIVVLFNPRTENWNEHFEYRAGYIFGQTPRGRATVALLAMNDPLRTELRLISSRRTRT